MESSDVIKLKQEIADLKEQLSFCSEKTDRHRRPESTDRGDSRFTLAMELVEDGLFDWDLQTNEIYYSDSWKRMLGYEPREIKNDFSVWETLTRPEDVARSWKMQKELINGKRDRFEIEFQMRHKQGHWVDILSRAKALFDDDGKALRMIGTHVDITERKKNERNMEKYKAIINSTFDVVITTDLEKRITLWNPGAEKLYGYRAEEVMGQAIDLIYRTEDLPLVEKTVQELLKGNNIPSISMRQIDKENREKHVLLSLVSLKDKKGEVIEFLGFTKDITELKSIEQELKFQKDRMATYLDLAGVLFIALDKDGTVSLANQKACKTLGYSQEEMLGKNWLENFIPHRIRETVLSVSNKLMEGDLASAYYFENPILTKTGEERLIAWHNTGLKDSEGHITGHLSSGEDITDKKILEMKIRQAQKMESLGILAGGIAHDFNNLLLPITGYAELLLDSLEPDSDSHMMAEQILSAGLRGSHLVKQILVFSRKEEPQRTPVCVQKVLEETLALCRATIPTSIAITRRIESQASWILGDKTNLHQVIMNLITNAYHAVSEINGQIEVELGEREIEHDRSGQNALAPGRYIRFAVKDNGMGIPEENREKIFDPYFTTKDLGKGSGLGLSVALGIIKSSDGGIFVSSVPAGGTCVEVYLPLKEEPLEDNKAQESPVKSRQPARILLVDDESMVARMETLLLEDLGYTVVSHTNSLAALEEFKSDPQAFDLLISDMTMPEITGEQLSAEVLAHRPDFPVIICTGYSDRMDQKTSREAGIRGFLTKPFLKDQLASLVEEVLKQSG